MRSLSPFVFLVLAASALPAAAAPATREGLAASIAQALRQSAGEAAPPSAVNGCDADLGFTQPATAQRPPAARRIVFSLAQLDALGSGLFLLDGGKPVLSLLAAAGAPAFRWIAPPGTEGAGPEFTGQASIPLSLPVEAAEALADDVALLARLCQPERYGAESTASPEVALPALAELWKTSTPVRRDGGTGLMESIEIVRQQLQSCQLFSDLKFTPEGRPSERYSERVHADLGDLRAASAQIVNSAHAGIYLSLTLLDKPAVVQTLWFSSRSGTRQRVTSLRLPFVTEAAALRFAGGIRHLSRSCAASKPPEPAVSRTGR